jgi:hypothetical protein
MIFHTVGTVSSNPVPSSYESGELWASTWKGAGAWPILSQSRQVNFSRRCWITFPCRGMTSGSHGGPGVQHGRLDLVGAEHDPAFDLLKDIALHLVAAQGHRLGLRQGEDAKGQRRPSAASAYLLVLISRDGDHRSLRPGRYACELIKEDSGQWCFSRRTVFHDHDYTLDGIGR